MRNRGPGRNTGPPPSGGDPQYDLQTPPRAAGKPESRSDLWTPAALPTQFLQGIPTQTACQVVRHVRSSPAACCGDFRSWSCVVDSVVPGSREQRVSVFEQAEKRVPVTGGVAMNEKLKRLRDAVTSRELREVEVGPDGQVREVGNPANQTEGREQAKPTKLAPRTFGTA